MVKKALLKFLNVEADELSQVLYLLLQGFLIGVFVATFEVTGSTLFVQYFDVATMLPVATIVQGFLGILVTYVFSYFQNKISFPLLSIISLLICTGVVFLLRIEFGLDFSKEAMEANAPIIFICFILVKPLEAVVLLIFWGTIARMFTLKQQKRIVGGIDLGKALATLSTFFAIPIFNNYLDTVDFLVVSNICIIVILLIVFGLVSQSQYLSFSTDKGSVVKDTKFPFIQMFRSRYIVMMILFVFVSTIAGEFVEYSFLNATETQYPNEDDLGNFIAVYGGITIIFSILAQTFAGDYITETYGLRIILLINPILLVLFTTLTIFVGTFMGFTVESGNFLLFFLCMSLSKLFAESLKEAFDEPSFKMFIFPIPADVRLKVLTRLDGIIKVSAVFLAGFLLLVIDNSDVFNLLSFSYFLVPIILAWMWIINEMHAQYKNSLKSSLVSTQDSNALNNIQSKDDSYLIQHVAFQKILEENMNARKVEDKLLFILKIMERTVPSFHEKTIIELSRNPRIYPDLKEYIDMIIEDLPYSMQEGFQDKKPPFNKLVNLSRSKKIEDRIEVCKWLSLYPEENTNLLMLQLLKDINPIVKIKAIDTARLIQSPELWNVLIDLLGNRLYVNYAMDALVEIGDKVIPFLELAFYKSGQKEEVMLRIIQIYGHIGSENAIQQLWKKISHPSHLVIDQVVLAFSYCNVKVPEENLPIIYNLLEVEIADAAWDIAALTEIALDEANAPLKASLEEEVNYNFTNIFRLLSLIYDSQSIQLVEDSLESEEDEGKVFALELLDLFVAQELKPMLFPVLEDINSLERINKLQEYFPRESFNSIEVLQNIIVRDYKYTNRWTRTTAMYALAKTEGDTDLMELVSNIFHSDPLIRNTAAWVICQKNKEIFENLKSRLDKTAVKEMEDILEKAFSNKYFKPLRIDKVLFMREVPILAHIQGDILADLVEYLTEVKLRRYQKLEFEKDNSQECMFLVALGEIQLMHNGETIGIFTEKDFISDLILNIQVIGKIEMIALKDSILYQVNAEGFYDMMTSTPNLVRNFIDNGIQIISKKSQAELPEEIIQYK